MASKSISALVAVAAAGVLAGGCGGKGAGAGDTPSGQLPSADTGRSIVIDHQEAQAAESLLPANWLAQAHHLKVVFGHQSVGSNILDGLNALGAADPSRFAVDVVQPPIALPSGGIAEFSVGQNGDPLGKIADYNTKIRAWLTLGIGYNCSMMKLCFVDFDSSTDATALFNAYRDAMGLLAMDYPSHVFIYTTAPLTTDYSEQRARYNDLVRAYCSAHDKVLFDIADIESHDPSGSAVGGGQPRMYAAYSSDGGHLTASGEQRIARAYWWLLARIAGWDGK